MIDVRHYTVAGVKLENWGYLFVLCVDVRIMGRYSHVSQTQERARFEETLSLCAV